MYAAPSWSSSTTMCATLVNYNGPETMRRKTALAMAQASGIMIWTVVDDTTDDNSLLRAIHAAPEEAGG